LATLTRSNGPPKTAALVANSKTLAIVVPGKPLQFLKRRDLIRLRHGDGELITRDGIVHNLRILTITRKRMGKEFLGPLVRRWYPDVDQSDLRLHLRAATTPRIALLIYSLLLGVGSFVTLWFATDIHRLIVLCVAVAPVLYWAFQEWRDWRLLGNWEDPRRRAPLELDVRTTEPHSPGLVHAQ
jgi:hypothetical protein